MASYFRSRADLEIIERMDQTWVVHVPNVERPWSIERTRRDALERAQQYAPRGYARVRRPNGLTERVRLGLSIPLSELNG